MHLCMLRLILPKSYIELNDSDYLIFLAGPIKGAPLWQDNAIEIINKIDDSVYLASPSKELRQSYLDNALQGDNNRFSRQAFWERFYLKKARAKSRRAIMFWLPAQTEEMPLNPNTNFPRSYARDTRGELGGWGWGILENDRKAPIIVGAEDNFDGLSVVKANFYDVMPDMKFYSTLEDTCMAAVRRV